MSHAGAWKAPAYPLWLGVWYTLIGHHVGAVRLVQAVLLGPITIATSWLLARRLFGPRVAMLLALVLAIYPFAFQYEELLYSESIATPLTVAFLLVVLTRPPTRSRAILAGVLLGLGLLVRPSAIFLVAPAAAAWMTELGARRGLLATASWCSPE
jgi:4-amino-4-deoxy-L-arabinose transferase-like glycosyltransferase